MENLIERFRQALRSLTLERRKRENMLMSNQWVARGEKSEGYATSPGAKKEQRSGLSSGGRKKSKS